MNKLAETLTGIIESDFAKETLCNLNDIIEYADNPLIDLDAARKIQSVGLKWLDAMENGSEWSLYRHQAMSALSDDAAYAAYAAVAAYAAAVAAYAAAVAAYVDDASAAYAAASAAYVDDASAAYDAASAAYAAADDAAAAAAYADAAAAAAAYVDDASAAAAAYAYADDAAVADAYNVADAAYAETAYAAAAYADHKENKLNSVSELTKGDILTNTNYHFDIKIKDIGEKYIRYINLETDEKVRSFTSKFKFMLRKGVFIKKPSI